MYMESVHRVYTLMMAIIFFATPLHAIASESITLDVYFSEALQRSESTAIKVEQIREAEERHQQANTALLPTVNGIATHTWQDPLPSGNPQTPASLSQQQVVRIAATQPLFRGLREYATLRQTKNVLAATEQDYQLARIQLYKDVLQNFFTLLSLQSDLKNYQEEIRLNQEREKEVRSRVQIGRSRQSELLNIQTTISSLRAQVEQLQGQLLAAQEAFIFLSGRTTVPMMQDTSELPGEVEPIEHYLNNIRIRPEIQAAQQRILAADEGIAVARGEHLPTLDLNANYYLERPGYLDDSKWDVQLALTVPIYAGGSVQSKIREAGAIRNQSELMHQQLMRQAEQEVRSHYQNLTAALAQLKALNLATETAKKSYEAQVREYRLGLVNSLDVNQALTVYQQNQRSRDHANINARVYYLQLLVAAGRIPKREGTS